MKKTNVCHQGIRWCIKGSYFTIFNSLLLIFLCSGQALAACQTASIPASTPTADFVVNGNGTVTHKKTGLMWKVCPEGLSGTTCTIGAITYFAWQAALTQAQTVNGAGFAGFTDWRVPNIKELDSIVELQCTYPPINKTIFPATGNGNFYWSASPSAGTNVNAWVVMFDLGNEGYSPKRNNAAVRLVRGGL